MEYKKYDIGPYNLHVINTSKFKTVTIRVNFKRPCIKNEITKRTMLSYLLTESCKEYDTRRKMEVEVENLYNLKYTSYNMLSGNYNVLCFEEEFINEEYTKIGYFSKSLNFIFNLIFKPNINNNKFNSNSFNLCKKLLKEKIDTIKENPSFYSNLRMLEEMDNKSVISYRSIGYISDLEKINEKNLYEYYLDILKNDIVDIFIIGNVDPSKVFKISTKLFNIDTIKKESLSHIVNHKKYRKNVKIVKEKMDIEQSKLIIGFKLKDLTDFERKYVMGIYSYILGGGPDSKLFKEVREKNSLCYSINSSYNGVYNILKISAGINSKNYSKTIKLIKQAIKDMSLGNFDDRDIKCAFMTYKNTFKEVMDNQSSILSSYVSMEYLKLDPYDKREKEILKVTKDMIVSVSSKINLDTIYLLEGTDE